MLDLHFVLDAVMIDHTMTVFFLSVPLSFSLKKNMKVQATAHPNSETNVSRFSSRELSDYVGEQ